MTEAIIVTLVPSEESFDDLLNLMSAALAGFFLSLS